MKKNTKFRTTANPHMAAAAHAKRTSGAAGPHRDSRDRRARTRQGQRSRWGRDQDAPSS